MPLAEEALADIVRELATRPRHEKVRSLLLQLLSQGLGARSDQILFEQTIGDEVVREVRAGRIDALLGRTLFEIKTDLRREGRAAEAQLARYLAEREGSQGARYVGIATDGAALVAYELRDGTLAELSRTSARPAEPRALLAWLEGVVAVQDRIRPDALAITSELGRESAAFARSLALLERAFASLADHPETQLKRQLWERHLAHVYGRAVDDRRLWLQHTYLVVVAKAIAAGVMRPDLPPPEPARLLSGAAFTDVGVSGAVEDDLFGWILDAPDGPDLVRRLAEHVYRFDLGDVDVDLLKVLYEALVDPAQRHELGEYYTPDWLAFRVVREALRDPANERVLDPSCGSGSFLFHAIRAKTQALRAADVPEGEIARRACDGVSGIDVHPVAVIFARVTVLLALGKALRTREGRISVPVYLGDALQWNVRRDLDCDLVVDVPPDPREPARGRRNARQSLRFPLGLCARPALFDQVLAAMQRAAEAGRTGEFARFLERSQVDARDQPTLRGTCETLRRLCETRRDHVWTFVARNLSRPVTLSDGGRVDVIVGNPPWLSYRFMARDMQRRFAESARALAVWVGEGEARLVTQTDLSGLFFARACELYLRVGGRIAMVMPLAAMTRGQFRAFRTGAFHGAPVAFAEAWVLDNQDISPVFRVPTCVLFARLTQALATALPDRATWFYGRLPHKDAPEEVARDRVEMREGPAPARAVYDARSPYADRFANGATLYPRGFCIVRRVDGGRLGYDAAAPLVRSRRSAQEKAPWKDLPDFEGAIEAAFLRPVFLGESIAPFRVLGASEAIVPVLPEGDMLDARQAEARGLPALAAWLAHCDALWTRHGNGRTRFTRNLDHFGKLAGQFPLRPLRVVFAGSGSRPAAALVEDAEAVVEHALYWAAVASREEGLYLLAILNSETARGRVAHLQARGEQGARHFDKLMFTLPIPAFDHRDPLHAHLVALATHARTVADAVELAPATPFVRARGQIREALAADGIAAAIDRSVAQLLDGAEAEAAAMVAEEV